MDTRINLLKAAGAIVAGFGVIVAGAGVPGLSHIALFLLDLLIWPLDGAQSLLAQEVRFIAAIGGGVMVGWGVMIWMIAPLMRGHATIIRSVVAWSIGTWFIVDSAGSVLAGVPANVLGNLAFVALFALALRPPAKTRSAA